uniref:Uncharacterized protein n=1 Tax=Oryza meridionalis TaxID=40149 RepID=A0A0E0DAL5_9ORYZ
MRVRGELPYRTSSTSCQHVDYLRNPTEFLYLSHGDAFFGCAQGCTLMALGRFDSFSRARDALRVLCIAIALKAPRESK